MNTLLFLLAIASSHAQAADTRDCARAITTPEIDACARRDLAASEEKLSAAFERAKGIASQSDESLSALLAAQEAWAAFRRKDCELIGAMYDGGREQFAQFTGCMSRHASERADALGEFSDSFAR